MKLLLVSLTAAAGLAAAPAGPDAPPLLWTTSFVVEKGELVSSGRNPYFILEPGQQSTFEGGSERLVITVLNETRMIDGVETRVVEERETKGGALVEVSRNYFAISTRSNSVFYFGEDVDMYTNGRVTSHGGAWLAGTAGAKFGLMMPGQVLIGGRYYQEMAPKVAMDRAEVLGMSERVMTSLKEWTNVLKVKETTPLEADVSYKFYAPGVGLIQDGGLKLVKTGKAEGPPR